MKNEELKAIRARYGDTWSETQARQDISALLSEVERLQAALHVDMKLQTDHDEWKRRSEVFEEVFEEVIKILLLKKKEVNNNGRTEKRKQAQ